MKRRVIIIITSLTVLIVLWFLAVDRSWFVEQCPACNHTADIIQFRILTIPVHERRREIPQLLPLIARDLGVPCSHPDLDRWHKHRYWGLLICAYPCINGIYALSEDISWYDETIAAGVSAMADANPSLRTAFVEKVLTNRDNEYTHAFVRRVASLRDRNTQP